jgi:ABC-type phosphonate transport system ATPase subunit
MPAESILPVRPVGRRILSTTAAGTVTRVRMEALRSVQSAHGNLKERAMGIR